MSVLANASLIALVSIFMGLAPLGMGIAYAIWPHEQRLALMRPLSLAAIFAALSGSALGVLNVLRAMGMSQTGDFSRVSAIGLAESLVRIFFGFGCLTAAWLCVALGIWRRPCGSRVRRAQVLILRISFQRNRDAENLRRLSTSGISSDVACADAFSRWRAVTGAADPSWPFQKLHLIPESAIQLLHAGRRLIHEHDGPAMPGKPGGRALLVLPPEAVLCVVGE